MKRTAVLKMCNLIDFFFTTDARLTNENAILILLLYKEVFSKWINFQIQLFKNLFLIKLEVYYLHI